MGDDLWVKDAQADGLCGLLGADVSEHLCAGAPLLTRAICITTCPVRLGYKPSHIISSRHKPHLIAIEAVDKIGSGVEEPMLDELIEHLRACLQ